MKWKYYGKNVYWREFFLLILLIALFTTDIFWFHYHGTESQGAKIAGNIINCLMAMILIRFVKTEFIQISYSIKDYFKEWSNYVDLAFIISVGSYIATNVSY